MTGKQENLQQVIAIETLDLFPDKSGALSDRDVTWLMLRNRLQPRRGP